MKRFFVLGALVLMALFLAGCNILWVPPGEVGIVVNQLGSNKGVESTPLTTGRYNIGAYHSGYLYPTYMKQYAFTKTPTEGAPADESFQFQTKEGVQVDVDIAVQAAADPALVATLFQTYRVKMEDILYTYVRQDLRELFIKYSSGLGVDDLYGTGKNAMLASVDADLKALYKPRGLIIESVSYLSAIRFPETITDSIQAKQKAQQDALAAENQVATAKAQAQQVVEKARGDAEANRLLTESLSSQILQKMAIEKWNGQLPTVTGSGGTPFINIPNK
jgi:regulator of protease activity HflC (stomatin/prohibitin superfamily)